MLGKNHKKNNIYEIPISSSNKILTNKFESSKFRRNSTNIFLEKFQKDYSNKYFQTSNQKRKSEISKNTPNNFVIRTPKNSKKISHSNNNEGNPILNLLDNLYQNEKHLKKHILKKKTKEHSSHKKKKSKVSFMDFTPKNKVLKFNSKKISFSNYINENMNKKYDMNGINKPKENLLEEEEDGQSYGFNKKYSLKMIDENTNDKNDKNIVNIEAPTPTLIKNSIINKNLFNDINIEGDVTHKTFNTTNIKSSVINKIKVPITKIKKSRSKQNLKKINKKSSKSSKEKEPKNKNNNVVNINYNINVKNEKNDKVRKRKNGNKKNLQNHDNNLNKTSKEKSEPAENKDKDNEKSKENDNNTTSKKEDKKLYKFNCCNPFLACLRGFND